MAIQPEKIPFWSTIDRAYEMTYDTIRPALRIALGWLLVTPLVVAAIHWLLWHWRSDTATLDMPTALALFASVLAGSSVAVAWHRLFLLGEHVEAQWYFRLDGKVLSYAIHVAAILIVPVVPGYVIEWIGAPVDIDVARGGAELWWGLALFAYVGFALVAIARLLLALPGLALDDPARPGLAAIWSGTRRNGLRLVAGCVVALVPSVVVISLIERFGPGRGTRLGFVVSEAMIEVAGTVFSVVLVAFLSLAYRQLFGARD